MDAASGNRKLMNGRSAVASVENIDGWSVVINTLVIRIYIERVVEPDGRWAVSHRALLH